MESLKDYLAFARLRPSLFKNPDQSENEIVLDEDEIQAIEAEVMDRIKTLGQPARWAEVGIVYEDQYLLFLHDAVRLANGSSDIVSRIVGRGEGEPGVVVLPHYQDHILLLRHFRHHTRTWHLELPQGFRKPGKSGRASILEELAEEIQATVSLLVPLGQMDIDTNVTPDRLNLFYARIESYGAMEKGEAISAILPVTVTEFEDLVRQGKITDANAIVTYTRARLRGLLPSAS